MQRITETLLFHCPSRENFHYMMDLEPLRLVLMKHGHLPPDGEKYKIDDPLFYVTGFNNYENTVEYSDELTPEAQRCDECNEAFHYLDLFNCPDQNGRKVCEFCFTLSAFWLLYRWEDDDKLQEFTPDALRIVATLRDIYITSDALNEAHITKRAEEVTR